MCEQWPIFPPPYWRKNSATRIPLNGLHKKTKSIRLKFSGYCNDQEKEEEHTVVDSVHVSLECRTLRGPLGSCMTQCGPNRDLCRVRTVRKVGRRGAILGICARRKMQGSIVQGFD